MLGQKAQKWLVTLVPLWIFLGLLALVTLLYRKIIGDLPRADHLIFIANFVDQGIHISDLPRTVFFEFFGSDKRFQPLAFTTVYFQWKLFGTNFFLYQLSSFMLHALNTTLLFMLVRRFTSHVLFSLFIAILFLTAYTHLDLLAWTVHIYVLLQITFILLAVLCLSEWRRRSGQLFLYLAYALIFIQMFFTELGVVFPIMLFLASLFVMSYKPPSSRGLPMNIGLVAAVYVLFAIPFFIFSVTDIRSLPAGLLGLSNIYRAFWSTLIEFADTAFLQNVLASAHIIVDDMAYFVPTTWQSLSPSGGTPLPYIGANILVLLAVGALFLMLRKPIRGQWLPFFLVLGSGFAATFLLMLARPTSYAISQSRYAYLPVLSLVAVLALLLAQHFKSVDNTGETKCGNNQRWSRLVVLIGFAVIILVNVAKLVPGIGQLAEYREHTNSTYYTVKQFISETDNSDAKLFVSVPTYPPHERLGWGTDIILDLFFPDEPRITQNAHQATHILLPGPTIKELAASSQEYIDDTSSLPEIEQATGNLLLNPELKSWSQGSGPFTGNGQMWADGWFINLNGGSGISVTREIIDNINIASVQYDHDLESYLLCPVLDFTPLLGKNATFAMQVKTDKQKAVRIGIGNSEFRVWSDFHPGDNAWHNISLTVPLPDDERMKSLNLYVALDKTAVSSVAFPCLSASAPEMDDEIGLSPAGYPDDFSIVFGFMPMGLPEEPLEVFGFTNATRDEPEGWFVRLLYDVDNYPRPGYVNLILGYREGCREVVGFYSRFVPTKLGQMNHFVLGREEGNFYFILNGELVQMEADITGLGFRNIKLGLGEVHSFVYPYFTHPVPYFAHKFVQVGSSRYTVLDKPIGHDFPEITFEQFGFMPYHLSLNW